MFETYTGATRQLFMLAQNEARDLNHVTVHPEHVFAALVVQQADNITSPFAAAGLYPNQVRAAIADVIPPGRGPTPGFIPLALVTKQLMSTAVHMLEVRNESEMTPAVVLAELLTYAQGMSLGDVLNLLNITEDELHFLAADWVPSQSTVSPPAADKAYTGPQTAPSPSSVTALPATITACGVDMTELARCGDLLPMVGREKQVDRLIRVLTRKLKNTPVLVGQPGVGKSAIVEGLAQRIVEETVPSFLKNTRVVSVNIPSMVAGSKYRGDFEEKLTLLIEAVKNRDDIVLFVDEMHMLMGAGAGEGTSDAANILKPALARGDIHLIGATTRKEYREKVAKDAAFERRCTVIPVDPPTVEEAVDMLRGARSTFETHHGVTYSDDALQAAVTLSQRHMPARFLPDKAFDLIDEAGALADLSRPTGAVAEALVVSGYDIANLVATLTGVPLSALSAAGTYTDVRAELVGPVVGQDEAATQVANTIRRAHVGLSDPERPLAAFMFAGPTGVGKTLMAKTLADALFASPAAFIRFDMGEFAQEHTVARLFGAPPGYVGYEAAGQLTSAVSENPYSLILFDEVEKAHPRVFDALLAVLGEARITTGDGQVVDFSHTVVVFTTNLGTSCGAPPGFSDAAESVNVKVRSAVKEFFRPEFVNRLDEVVLFSPLSFDALRALVDGLVGRLAALLSQRDVTFSMSASARAVLPAVVAGNTHGARDARRNFDQQVTDTVASLMANGTLARGQSVHVDVPATGDGFVFECSSNLGRVVRDTVTTDSVAAV